MADVSSCSNYVLVFVVTWYFFHLVASNERLALNTDLTRDEITTVLRRRVNLGCYVTKNYTTTTPRTRAPSPVTYVWLKDNNSVTETENSKIYQNVLVLTPNADTDFGTYTCNVTNGVSSTRCRIILKRGWTKAEHVKIVSGCVNISVLMPVLAVAVLSFLLFIHLIIRRKDDKQEPLPPETPQGTIDQRRRSSSVAHPHAEQRLQTRRLSRDILYNSYREKGTTNNNESKQAVVSIEMHVGGDLHSTPKSETGLPVQRERKQGFYNRAFHNVSVDLDDDDNVASHEQGDKVDAEGDDSKDIGFLNKNFKNGSMDSTEGDYPRASVDTVFDDSKSKGGHGFYNKTFKNESMENVETTDDVFVTTSEGAVLDKSKSGNRKGFFNNNFHSDSMDMSDDSASASGDMAAVVAGMSGGAVLDKSKSGNRKGFFNNNFHSDSMDMSDDSASASGDMAAVVAGMSGGAVLDKSKSGNRKGFFNNSFHSDSIDASDDSASASGDIAAVVVGMSGGAVLDKSKSGNRKGFFNKTFHSDSLDIPDESEDGARDSGDAAANEAKETENAAVDDTYF